MFARLGRVIYWASCLMIACGIVALSVKVGWEDVRYFLTAVLAIPVYLFGLLCLYIFSNETPKWRRMEKFMALVATLGVASFSIVMIDSQMDKASPAWMSSPIVKDEPWTNDPIVEESADSEKTYEELMQELKEIEDFLATEKPKEKFYLDPVPVPAPVHQFLESLTDEQLDQFIQSLERRK